MQNAPVVELHRPADAAPIWDVIEAAPNTLGSIAPERIDDLLPLLEGLRIKFTDDNAFDACKLYAEKTIIVSRGFVEVIWLATWSQLAIEEILNRQAADGQALVLDEADQDVRRALDALRAAIDLAVRGTPINWTMFPKPVPPAPATANSSHEEKAGEFALTALAFVLHHELAHDVLRHAAGEVEWTLDQEKDADGHAVEWILSGAQGDARRAAKRAFGIVTVLVVLAVKRLREMEQRGRVPHWGTQDHPYPHDRLDRVLRHEVVAGDRVVTDTMTRLAAIFLFPHLLAFGVPIAREPADDFPALLDRCVNALAEFCVGSAPSAKG